MNDTLPKIIFQRAAPFYEDQFSKNKNVRHFSEPTIKNKIDSLRKRWNKDGQKILKEITRVTGLEYLEQDIRCYITPFSQLSFSHPLTLKVYDSLDDMFDVFTHEMIHRLFSNPNHPKRFHKGRKLLFMTYSKESLVTKRHILVHALHSHILKKFFGQDRLNKAINFSKKKDYVRSWKIVNETGFENIIKDFKVTKR